MVPLCDEAQVEACFGLSDIELILTQDRCMDLEIVFVSVQDRCMDLEIVFVSVQDRCMVCARRTIGSEIILDPPDGTTTR